MRAKLCFGTLRSTFELTYVGVVVIGKRSETFRYGILGLLKFKGLSYVGSLLEGEECLCDVVPIFLNRWMNCCRVVVKAFRLRAD